MGDVNFSKQHVIELCVSGGRFKWLWLCNCNKNDSHVCHIVNWCDGNHSQIEAIIRGPLLPSAFSSPPPSPPPAFSSFDAVGNFHLDAGGGSVEMGDGGILAEVEAAGAGVSNTEVGFGQGGGMVVGWAAGQGDSVGHSGDGFE